MPLKIYSPAHLLALDTDRSWSAELSRLFGKRAGDVRYTKEGRGAPGSLLRLLYEARTAANEAWRKEVESD